MEKSKKIVLFDIDYTLFNTDEYRRILYPRLADELLIPHERFYLLCREAEAEMKERFGHFSPEAFIQKLREVSNGKVSLERLEEILWDKEMYAQVLEKKSRETFDVIRKSGIAIGLLSTGDSRHQLAKVETLLTYLPKEHMHIFSNKIDSLKKVMELYREYLIYLVDDLPIVLTKAKEIRSDTITILKKSKKYFESDNEIENFNPDWEINDISEVVNIVVK